MDDVFYDEPSAQPPEKVLGRIQEEAESPTAVADRGLESRYWLL